MAAIGKVSARERSTREEEGMGMEGVRGRGAEEESRRRNRRENEKKEEEGVQCTPANSDSNFSKQ